MPPVSSKNYLLVFDIDGTLLNSQHKLLPSTLCALKKARKRGHSIVLASARPPGSMVKIAAAIDAGNLPAICLNGALIVNTQTHTTIWEKSMDWEAVRYLIDLGHEYQFHLSIMTEWEWLVEEDSDWARTEAAIVEIEPTVAGDFSTLPKRPVHKMLAVGEREKIVEFRQQVATADIGVSATISNPTYCELVDSSVSKANSLLYLCSYYEIPRENVVVFGDGENDVTMMEVGGTGIAMGNASCVVKAAADYVTKSNDEDGIAHALTHLGII